jgi:hypothetical protein
MEKDLYSIIPMQIGHVDVVRVFHFKRRMLWHILKKN